MSAASLGSFDSTTDIDVISSTVRFSADTIWYPEIARTWGDKAPADFFQFPGGWAGDTRQVGACEFNRDGTGVGL